MCRPFSSVCCVRSAALGPVSVSARWSGRPVVAAVQLCAAGPCAAPSAACVTSGDGQPLVADAGRLTNSTALVVKDSSQLQLDLAPGQPCSSQGRNTTFNTTVLFVCDPSDQESERQRPLAVFGDCSLTVIWYTAGACGRPAAAPAACPLLAYGPLRSRPGLAGLASARWSAVGAGVSVQARLCGGGDGPCAGAPLCVAAGGRAQAVGSADRPPRLAATANGSVTLTYGPSDGERAEVALRCREEAGAGRLLVVGRRQPRLLQLALETAVVCPVRRVDCRVTAEDGTVRDLSALSLETGAWETADRAAGRAGDRFFINMCRALGGDSGAALCGGVAGTAVCLRAETGDPVSLGAVAGPPSRMADGSISIVYSNGSPCGGDRYSSELQLVCGPLRDGAPLLLGRAHCRFTFLWETVVACGRQESSGGRCAVVEPLYGHRLDVSALRRPDSDYALPLDGGGTLYLNLCGPLVRRCAGAAGQGACLLHANGTELSYGGASSRLWHSDGVLSLRLTGGARCGPSANHSTRVVFTCDQRAPAAAEPGLVHLGCTSFVVVPTRLACPPRRAADCRTPDGRFDLSALTALTGNHEYREPGATYVLNVCHSVNPEQGVNCPPDAAVCLVRPAGNGTGRSYTSLGAVSAGPTVDGDRLLLRYSTGQRCDGDPARRLRAAEIRFSCDPTAQGTQPRLVSTDDCVFRFAWTTASACPLQQTRGAANCSVENPQTGFRFDLSPLARPGGYSASLRDNQYRLNVCSPLPATAGCPAGTGICKTAAASPAGSVSVGAASGNLVYDAGVLLLSYGEGAPCDGGGRYSTVISFFCGPDGEPSTAHVVEDDRCAVTVHWPTQLACETRVECAVDTPDGLVDLRALAALGGASPDPRARPAGSDDPDLPCRCVSTSGAGLPGGPVRPAAPPAAPAAHSTSGSQHQVRPRSGSQHQVRPRSGSQHQVRHRNGSQHQGLGHVVSPPRFSTDHVTLTYEHGSPCAGQPGRNLSTELQLYCNASQPATESRPEWPLYADCRYTFRWRSAAACPLSPASGRARRQCLVGRPDGTVRDLSTLTAQQSEQVQFAGRTVRLRPCHADPRCAGAVCVDNSSFGDEASFSVSESDGGAVTLEYSTDAACAPQGEWDGGAVTLEYSTDAACAPQGEWDGGAVTLEYSTDSACAPQGEWDGGAVTLEYSTDSACAPQGEWDGGAVTLEYSADAACAPQGEWDGGAVTLEYSADAACAPQGEWDGGAVTLEYSTDAACAPQDGGPTTRGATLRLTCDRTLGRGSPVVTRREAPICHR
ncbi:Cation-independent mannose-6-phosphate receptor [Amphibalanus amphitrite]|uniref:Cation-independent mannose-6-phosphate receptor n=1 Tax=Amphibalanus amphitrite TaxID=1232801 RepID=A0A6A4WYM9_AMPAM|nr:Cation-independent mannose-6-phosphate receptor [Amphibalanus amphitrite]